MFNFFRQKTSAELEQEAMLKALKQSAKEIKRHKGMYVEVCKKFADFAIENELYKGIGLLWDKEVPYSKIHISHASLMLLGALKNGIINDTEDSYLYLIAKFSFEHFNLIMSSEELKPLLEDVMLLNSVKGERLKSASEKWVEWEYTNVETLRLIARL